MLDPNKEYRTKHNEPIRIYAVDGGASGTEIHGAIKYTFGWSFAVWGNEQSFYDCGNREYNPLAKLKVGDPIIVWDTLLPNDKYIRIFAGVVYKGIYKGRPQVYINGTIQHETTISYDNFDLLPNYNYGE